MEYFLSAHASSQDGLPYINVPSCCTVYFYVPLGQILPNNIAFPIFDNLAQNNRPGGTVDHTYNSGSWIPNYRIWHLVEYPGYSGIYSIGTRTRPAIDLGGFSYDRPFFLQEVFWRLYNPTELYWVACA